MEIQVFLAVIGFAAGFIVAGGVIALLVGLGSIARFAGIGHTARDARLYETAIFFGALYGTGLTIYQMSLQLGGWWVAIQGIFSGIFVGGWIMALAEVAKIFPVFVRRIGITKGISFIVIAVAFGKTIGAMLYFYFGWGLS